MQLFNDKTTIKDLEPFFNWNVPMMNFYLGIESKKKEFAIKFKQTLPFKKKEVLYYELFSNSQEIAKISTKITEENTDTESWYFFEDRRWFSYLYHEIFIQYKNGNNPQVEVFKDLAIHCIEYEIDEINNLHIAPLEERNLFKKMTLVDAATKLFTETFIFATLNSIGEIEYREYLESYLEEIEPTGSANKKLNWTGTPAEFGAIFETLIQNEYIEKVKDLKSTARILERMFDIKNDEDEPVNFDYLYKCFGEKKRKYNPGELKIPKSDNVSKIRD